jgi:DNA-binding SARP family transcriptional activator
LGDLSGRRGSVRTLLKWFLLNPSDRVSASSLCEMLWPGREPARASNNLHVTLHYLRHALEPDLAKGARSRFLRHDRHQQYWFEMGGDWWTDVLEVRELARAGAAAESDGDIGRAIELYDRVTNYHELSFMPEDVYDDTFADYRRQQDQAHGEALRHLMRLYARVNQLPSAHAVALRALQLDPYDEQAVKTLVMVRLSDGNVAAAARQLDGFFDTLERDLGRRPDSELVNLRSALRSGDFQRHHRAGRGPMGAMKL